MLSRCTTKKNPSIFGGFSCLKASEEARFLQLWGYSECDHRTVGHFLRHLYSSQRLSKQDTCKNRRASFTGYHLQSLAGTNVLSINMFTKLNEFPLTRQLSDSWRRVGLCCILERAGPWCGWGAACYPVLFLQIVYNFMSVCFPFDFLIWQLLLLQLLLCCRHDYLSYLTRL